MPLSTARAPRWTNAALVVAAFAPFLATLFYGYVYDDTSIILRDPVLNGWRSLREVWTHPYWGGTQGDVAGLYRPLLMAMFAVLWNGAHKFAIAFHLLAVGAHALATMLLWRVLRRSAAPWAAAGAALWFAVLPVHVEAVANISNSSEVLVGVWTLLLVLVVAKPPTGWRLLAAGALYAAAFLTKESGAVAPVLALIAMAGWREPPLPETRGGAAVIRRWIPTLVAWAGVVAVVALARHRVLGGFAGRDSIAAPGIESLPSGERVWAMLSLGGRVLRLLFWPGTLNPHYGPSTLPTAHGPTAAALATVLVILATFGACAIVAVDRRWRDPRPLAAVLWIGVAFFPASNLLVPTGQILAERTLYVSSMGSAMLVAWTLDRIGVWVRGQRVAVAAIAALFLALCASEFQRSRDYAGVWKDHLRLFTYMTVADSSSYRGYQLLSMEMTRRHRDAEATRLYDHAYSLYPSDPILSADYAEFLLKSNRPAEALRVARTLMTHPDLRTTDRAVSLYLTATGAALGRDSLLAVGHRLAVSDPSRAVTLFLARAQATNESAAPPDASNRR